MKVSLGTWNVLGKGKVGTVGRGGEGGRGGSGGVGGRRKERRCAVAGYRKGQLVKVIEVVLVWLNFSWRVM